MSRINSLLRPYWLFLPLCFGVFIAADDQTVVVTILPDMLSDLRVAAGELDRASWAVTGYLIGYTAAMPLMGRISDRFGYRNTYLAAMGVFALGSVGVAISADLPRWLFDREPEYSWMVGARVFQAIGGGAVIPVSLAAAGELVDGKHRAIAYGLVGASAEAGGVIGPLWGGVVTEWLSWEWLFWLNLPLVLVVVALLLRLPSGSRHSTKIDMPGAALFAIALTFLTIGLTRSGEPDALFGIAIVVTTVSVLLLIMRLIFADDPLFPRALFRLLSFTTANAAHFLIGAALIIGMVAVPLMAGTVYGESALEGGLKLLRMTIAIGFGALIGGMITQRIGPLVPGVFGVVLTVSGFLLMSGWDLQTGDPALTLHLVIAGLGFGLLVAPIAEAALSAVRSEARGSASALLTVSRMIGMTAGLAIMTSLGTVQFVELVADIPAFSLDPVVQDEIELNTRLAGLEVFRDFFRTAAIATAVALPFVVTMSVKRTTEVGNAEA